MLRPRHQQRRYESPSLGDSCRFLVPKRHARIAKFVSNLNGVRMSFGGLMVSVSGVRGRIGEGLTPEVVARYAGGFGVWSLARSTSREIVLGRDSRVSGPTMHRIVTGALQAAGADVIDIG